MKKKKKNIQISQIISDMSNRRNIEESFKEFLIMMIGIITGNKDKLGKHTEISINPHKDFLLKEFSEEINWKYERESDVPYIAFWIRSNQLVKDITKGIYPIFYYYKVMKDNKEEKIIVLSFGKSVKNKPLCDWDENLSIMSIDEFFKKEKMEKLPLHKNDKVNYGNSKIYKTYSITNDELLELNFQDEIYTDFIELMHYYINYLKYKENELSYKLSYKEYAKICKNFLLPDYHQSFKTFENYENVIKKINVLLNKEDSTLMEKVKETEENKIVKNIDFSLNTILFGSPGTGKTYNARAYSVGIVEKDERYFEKEFLEEGDILEKYNYYEKKGNIKFISFHQSYSYEDFIEGIRPKLNSNETKLDYKIHRGIFKELCDKAQANKDQNYVLIIDEINRGNISNIFGELISLIEAPKRLGAKEELKVLLPYSGTKFGVPNNLYIIGTMNSSDKSIAVFDNAFRRRFNYIEFLPEYKLLRNKVVEGIELERLLLSINERIEFLIGKEHLLGQSYFMGVTNLKDLSKTFKFSIIPLLEEYFYEDYEKIRTILRENEMISFKDKELYIEGKNKNKRIYTLNKEFFDNPRVEEFQKIYISTPKEA